MIFPETVKTYKKKMIGCKIYVSSFCTVLF